MWGFLQQVDYWLFTLINQTLTLPPLDYLMITVTDKRFGWIFFAVVLGVLMVERRGEGLVSLLLVVVVIACADQLTCSLLKPLFGRPRPPYTLEGVRLIVSTTTSGSFPSSHASVHFAAATMLQLRHRGLGWVMFPTAILVSYSRVYVGVHYPSDILGGAVVGTVVGIGVWALYLAVKELWRRKLGWGLRNQQCGLFSSINALYGKVFL